MHLTNRSKVRCFKISNGVGTRSINIWVRILGHFNQIEIIDMALENLGTTSQKMLLFSTTCTSYTLIELCFRMKKLGIVGYGQVNDELHNSTYLILGICIGDNSICSKLRSF